MSSAQETLARINAAIRTIVPLNQVGTTNQLTGSYSEGGPSDDPPSISRDFKCILQTADPLDDIENILCSARAASGSPALTQATLDPVTSPAAKFFTVTIQLSRPNPTWPAVIVYDFAARAVFAS